MPITDHERFFEWSKVPEKRNTIWGTLNFPANAPRLKTFL